MGVAAILAQDPHSRPASTDRSPAPFVHASDVETEAAFRSHNRAFVDAFRAGARRLRERARALVDLFPPLVLSTGNAVQRAGLNPAGASHAIPSAGPGETAQ